MDIILSAQQQAAVETIKEFLHNFEYGVPKRPYCTIGGYAGTGKSTMAEIAMKECNVRAVYLTYTGKAALVLNKMHNVGARTIHSMIYRPVEVSADVLKELKKELDEEDREEYKQIIQDKLDEAKGAKFELKEDAFADCNADVILLDECSMVNDAILEDLTSFNKPIIALGDPGQLPPIDGTGALFAHGYDAMLTEVRRQALDSPIIEYSMWAREQRTIPFMEEGAFVKMPKGLLLPEEMEKLAATHDITICWRNETRQKYNRWWRQVNGWYEENGRYPIEGETIIFTRNNRDYNVYNGQFAEVIEVLDIYDMSIKMKVLPEGRNNPVVLEVLRAGFDEYVSKGALKSLNPWDYQDKVEADFGYCITCHKAQGSQWDRVLVLDEDVFKWWKGREQRAQWLYTAITRAAEKVTIVAGR